MKEEHFASPDDAQDIICPHCKSNITDNQRDDIEFIDGEELAFTCTNCSKTIKIYINRPIEIDVFKISGDNSPAPQVSQDITEKINIASCKKATIVIIPGDSVPDDVLERLEDKEDFADNQNEEGTNNFLRPKNTIIFAVSTLFNLLNDEEDDTNDSTRNRIDILYNKVKEYDYLMITK